MRIYTPKFFADVGVVMAYRGALMPTKADATASAISICHACSGNTFPLETIPVESWRLEAVSGGQSIFLRSHLKVSLIGMINKRVQKVAPKWPQLNLNRITISFVTY
jgi:hypothetical protein